MSRCPKAGRGRIAQIILKGLKLRVIKSPAAEPWGDVQHLLAPFPPLRA